MECTCALQLVAWRRIPMAGGGSGSNHNNTLCMEVPHAFYPANSSGEQPVPQIPINSRNTFAEGLVQSPPLTKLSRSLTVCEDGSISEDAGQYSISSSSGSADQSSGLLPLPPLPPPPPLQAEGGGTSRRGEIFTSWGGPAHSLTNGGGLEAPPFPFQSSVTTMQPQASALWGHHLPLPQPPSHSQYSPVFFPGCVSYLPTSQPPSQHVIGMPIQRPDLHQTTSHVNSRTFSMDRTQIVDGYKGGEEDGEGEGSGGRGVENGRGTGSVSRRKNVTRESTSTLKAWLRGHMKNPYPTKGEKIMLAIITKMTITQVSTWFANARRRLKKENKMTWLPANRPEGVDKQNSSSQPSSSNVVVTATSSAKVEQAGEEDFEVEESDDEEHETSLFDFHSAAQPSSGSLGSHWQQNYSSALAEAPIGGGTSTIGGMESGESYEEVQQQSPCMWRGVTAPSHSPSAALFPPAQYTYNEVIHLPHHPLEKQWGRESHLLTHPTALDSLGEEMEEGKFTRLNYL